MLLQHPDNASLYYNRGLLYLRQKAWVEARVDFKKFVELHPESADGHNNLAITYYQVRDYSKANECWEAAGRKNPQSPVYFKNRVLVLEKLKQNDEALSLVKERIRAFPQEDENLLLRAHFLGLAGRSKEQAEDFSKYLEAHPNRHSIRARRALLYETLGEREKAEGDLRLLTPVLTSVDVSLQRPLILMADRLQQNESVLSLLRLWLPAHPDDLDLIRLGVRAALVLKRNDLAVSCLSKGWDTTRDETLLLQRAGLYLEMRKEELALQDLDVYRQHAGPDTRQALLRTQACLQMEQWDKALDAAETALDLAPDNVEALQKRALILGHLGRFEDALAAFGKILKRKQDDSSSLYNRGLCRLAMGHEKEALDDFSTVLRLHPGHPEARQNRANLYFAQKLWKEAASDFCVLLEKEPGNAEYWLKLATAEFRAGQIPESKEHYAKAKALDPKLPDYEYYFGEWVK